MSRLIYALSGEGRGHATRARTVIDELRGEQTISVYTYGQGAELLGPIYRGTEVEVRELPGLRFSNSEGGSLDYMRTGMSTLPFEGDAQRLGDVCPRGWDRGSCSPQDRKRPLAGCERRQERRHQSP